MTEHKIGMITLAMCNPKKRDAIRLGFDGQFYSAWNEAGRVYFFSKRENGDTTRASKLRHMVFIDYTFINNTMCENALHKINLLYWSDVLA